MPIMHHAEQGPGSRSSLTPVTVTDPVHTVQRSAAAGARRGNVEPAARLARAWPAPGLGWVANLLGLWAAAERNEKLVD